MIYLAFAIFFALNLSLCFIFPSLILKMITKPSKKKKDNKNNNSYLIYVILTIIYILVYIIFFKYYFEAITNLDTNIFYDGIANLSIISIFFLIISILQISFTFLFSKRLFKIKEFKQGYIIASVTGTINILTYFFSNSVLGLGTYSFEANKYLLNFIMNIDVQFLLFIFPLLVFAEFATSFLEESS